MALYARSGGIALQAVPNRFTGLVSRALISIAVFGLPLTMSCARICEAPTSLLGWSRMLVSLAAAAILIVARRRDFTQRLVLAFLLEAGSGIATFAYVDVPFVIGHSVAIADSVASAYTRITERDLRSDLRVLPIAL